MRITRALFSLLAGVPPAADEKVKIIHIIGGDVGYDDLFCFGSRDIATANLDALAKEGMRLTSFYAPASTCTPSRAAILTGRFPPRVQGCERVLFPNDILPLLKAKAGAKSPHAAFYGVEKKQAVSVREGPWNFVASGSELYNMDEDLAEKTNMASAHPEIVERLKARLAKATQSFQNDRPLE